MTSRYVRCEMERWPAVARLCDDSPNLPRIRNATAFHRLLGTAIADPAALTPKQSLTALGGHPTQNAKRPTHRNQAAQRNVTL